MMPENSSSYLLEAKISDISFTIVAPAIGWLRLFSDMSKVGNVNLPGRQIDKHDEISG